MPHLFRDFPAPRSVSLFLFTGGLCWTGLFFYLDSARQTPWILWIGFALIPLWGLRGCNIGNPLLWKTTWILSILWHLASFVIGVLFTLLSYLFMADAALLLAAIPLWWIGTALVLSSGSLISEWNLSSRSKMKA